jgi:hypothetical protein
MTTTTSLYDRTRRDRTVWQNEEVYAFEGALSELLAHVPTFERWPLAFDHGARRQVPVSLFEDGFIPGETGINPYYDTVIRQPLQPMEHPIPVGIVSKSYALVQHREILAALLELLPAAKLDPATLPAKLRITELGTRMAVRVVLADNHAFDPGDGNKLFLCLECLNSVDGSSRLRLHFSWLRLVCSNGLMVNHAGISGFQRLHTNGLEISEVAAYISENLQQINKDKARLRRWQHRALTAEQVTHWVDGPLAKAWGCHAACRAYHIIMTGEDGEIADPFEAAPPHERRLTRRMAVPGAVALGLNAYAASQALSWLVGTRHDLEDQATRAREITPLIEKLLRMN